MSLGKTMITLCAIYLLKVVDKKVQWKYLRGPASMMNKTMTRVGLLLDFDPESDVNFWLYTWKNPIKAEHLFIQDDTSVIHSNFDFRKDTKVLIHGWKNTGNSTFCTIVKNAYVEEMEVNVIVVDWRKLSLHSYPISRKNMWVVARKVAMMIEFLWQLVPKNSVHVIGHSLGAHVAGISGEVVRGGRIHRITGLDPAGPLFSVRKTRGRLDRDDADFVDIIHTSGFALGFHAALGHADFYPNKGVPIQPGCGVDVVGKCSHRRSYHLYKESIYRQKHFLAAPCNNWKHYKKRRCGQMFQTMGEFVNKSARGKFYLMTSDTPPFALGYAYNTIRKNKLRFTTISRRTIMQYIHSPHV